MQVSRSSVIKLRPTDVLITAGEKADKFFVIAQGSLNLYPPEKTQGAVADGELGPESPTAPRDRSSSPEVRSMRIPNAREEKAELLRRKMADYGNAKKKMDDFMYQVLLPMGFPDSLPC